MVKQSRPHYPVIQRLLSFNPLHSINHLKIFIMKKLLKQYGLNSDMEYYQMVADSFINGQITQGKTLFNQMVREYRVKMVRCILFGGWQSGLSKSQEIALFDAM